MHPVDELVEKMKKAILLVAIDYEPEQVIDALELATKWLLYNYSRLQPKTLHIQ